jgi:transcription elongation factor GreA
MFLAENPFYGSDQERFPMTQAGFDALQGELRTLEARQQEQIKDLDDFSVFNVDPMSEEAAASDVNRRKRQTDERVNYLRFVLERADVIADDPDPKRIDPGDKVTLWDLVNKTNVQYDLIGSPEAAIGREGVSIESPVGKALKGQRVGDLIEVETPDGLVRYIVRKIERNR